MFGYFDDKKVAIYLVERFEAYCYICQSVQQWIVKVYELQRFMDRRRHVKIFCCGCLGEDTAPRDTWFAALGYLDRNRKLVKGAVKAEKETQKMLMEQEEKERDQPV